MVRGIEIDPESRTGTEIERQIDPEILINIETQTDIENLIVESVKMERR